MVYFCEEHDCTSSTSSKSSTVRPDEAEVLLEGHGGSLELACVARRHRCLQGRRGVACMCLATPCSTPTRAC